MRRAYLLLFLIAPTLAAFPEPISEEDNSAENLLTAQSNENVASENAEVAAVSQERSNVNENANEPSEPAVGNKGLKAAPEASKKFGVILVNTTSPFVFNPSTAAFAFNVSKGRESQGEKSKTVGKDGGKRPDLLRVSANALCQAECEAQEKTFIKVDSEGPSCVCGCPVPETQCAAPTTTRTSRPRAEALLRYSTPAPDCCTNNNCNEVCQSAQYDGGECDDDGTCHCYCSICENPDEHCLPAEAASEGEDEHAPATPAPAATPAPPPGRRPRPPKRPSKN